MMKKMFIAMGLMCSVFLASAAELSVSNTAVIVCGNVYQSSSAFLGNKNYPPLATNTTYTAGKYVSISKLPYVCQTTGLVGNTNAVTSTSDLLTLGTARFLRCWDTRRDIAVQLTSAGTVYVGKSRDMANDKQYITLSGANAIVTFTGYSGEVWVRASSTTPCTVVVSVW